MSGEWIPVFVLPNVQLLYTIECDIAALAPAGDPRVAALKRTQPMFRRFLGRFADNFGQKFEPSVHLLRADAPPKFLEIGALASFRDLIAISAVAYNRALELRHGHGHRVLFGEAFAIYPWMLDKHYEDVIGNTAAILGTHEVASFKGQSSPAIFRNSLDSGDVDQPLLAALLQRWQRRYEAVDPDWSDIALFRSLNMAYHASLLPAATDTTFYDVGRLVSLWVSAFEILVHPGGNGQANRDKVFELIEKTPWELQATADLSHDTGGKTKVKRTLASWLYQALYECRNNFLHGNPVERANLVLPISGRALFEYAAPLYRLALTAFLPLTYGKAMPSSAEAKAFGAYIADRMEFMTPQRGAEEAILTAIRQSTPRPGRLPRSARRRPIP
jgi:hypothetical protein